MRTAVKKGKTPTLVTGRRGGGEGLCQHPCLCNKSSARLWKRSGRFRLRVEQHSLLAAGTPWKIPHQVLHQSSPNAALMLNKLLASLSAR